MRSFRVKVTTDLEYYLSLGNNFLREGLDLSQVNGLYSNNVIWVRTLNPLILFHEFIHHLIGLSDDPWYISPRLFADFLQVCWDVIYFRLTRIRISKERSKEALRRLRESWNDWLDWVLCR